MHSSVSSLLKVIPETSHFGIYMEAALYKVGGFESVF
jgi:hypothetical protein